jgi:four helix bundle protein
MNELSRVATELDNSQTDFWLNLLHDNGYLDDIQYDSLKHDMDRILKILTSIVKTLNEKVKKK